MGHLSRMAKLEGYRFGRLVVDGTEVTKDVIVLPDRVVRNWWRIDGHALQIEDLDDVVEDLPEKLIVGTGADQRMRPDPEVLRRLEGRGVEVEVLATDRAVERYAQLDPAKTAVALHLTC